MSSIDFEFDLTDTEREVQRAAHRFAEEVMRPIGQRLDKLPDPADVFAEGSELWDAFDQYEALGLGSLQTEDSDLTPVERARIRSIICEEMGWGDAGLALTLGARSGGFPQMFARLSGNPELIERFTNDDHREISCWAITEPDHGSDTLALNQPHFEDPSIRANCIAKLDGDDFIISGQKSSWVTNGPIATVAALYCTIEGDKGFAGGGIALVPLDLPGVSKGKPLDKIGQRALTQGEIFFDDVRIPKSYMVIGQDAYKDTLDMTLTLANSFMGMVFAGVARSAYDLALGYARERVV